MDFGFGFCLCLLKKVVKLRVKILMIVYEVVFLFYGVGVLDEDIISFSICSGCVLGYKSK